MDLMNQERVGVLEIMNLAINKGILNIIKTFPVHSKLFTI